MREERGGGVVGRCETAGWEPALRSMLSLQWTPALRGIGVQRQLELFGMGDERPGAGSGSGSGSGERTG